MTLTKEQEALLNGEKGEVMAKIMKTLVMFGDTFGAERLKKCGVVLSYICPLMHMNNPLCKAKPVITSSNKLRTYTSARYYTDREILDIITSREGTI